MRICLNSVEIFHWGKYGGFGIVTRTIGRELARRKHEVFAVVPRRGSQKPVETLDGMTVFGFPPYNPFAALRLFRECDADVYHSLEPSFATWLAMRAMPSRRHVVTCIDPRLAGDWRTEYRFPSASRPQVIANRAYEDNVFVRRAVARADAVYVAALFIAPKAKTLYGLTREPEFLPVPVHIPGTVEKNENPTVCFLARLDRRKRPTLFLELAKGFPEVTFIAMGKSRDTRYEAELRAWYGHLPNLKMVGFVDPFDSGLHGTLLGRSWILVNTSAREGLPLSFLEAAAHRCAILSAENPDGFASRFGYHAKEDDFAAGLAYLLEDGRWRARGEKGYEYVRETFETGRAIDLHLAAYERALGNR